MCEKLNISACRYALAVHRKYQARAVRGELGRNPLGLDVLRNIVSYRDYLEMKSAGIIMAEALILNKALAENNSSNKIWASSKGKIGQLLGREVSNGSTKSNTKQVISKLRATYTDMWDNKISTEAKMRTYTKLKVPRNKRRNT